MVKIGIKEINSLKEISSLRNGDFRDRDMEGKFNLNSENSMREKMMTIIMVPTEKN